MSAEKSSGSSSVQTHQPPKVHGGLHLSVVPLADDAKTDVVSPSSRIKSDKDNTSPASKRRYFIINPSFLCFFSSHVGFH